MVAPYGARHRQGQQCLEGMGSSLIVEQRGKGFVLRGTWIDALHHHAHRARSIDLNAVKQLLNANSLANSADGLTALEAVFLPLLAHCTSFDTLQVQR